MEKVTGGPYEKDVIFPTYLLGRGFGACQSR